MQILDNTINRYKKSKPLKGVTLGFCLHITKETSVLLIGAKELGATVVIVDAGIEHELSEVADDERENFRRELGAIDDGINTLIRKGYELLNLITFFTTGEKETRGWTIVEGSTAPEAGAAIHTDFQIKYIRADVISWGVLLEVGSYAHARDKGLIKTVGKDYVVADGDVIEFKI